jgi:hypothetical protein
MQKIMRDECKLLASEIEAAIAHLMAKHGLSVKVGNCTFDGVSMTTKVTVTTSGAGERDQQQAIAFAKLMGVDASRPAAGWTLVDYRSKGRTKPWVIEKAGKRYVTTTDHIKRLWGNA